jgi:N-acetylneuraminic acid mutarotase
MLIWGGENPSKFNSGYFYDPATNSWAGLTTTVGAPSARSHHSAVWTGSEMIVWGGGEGGPHLATGARYNPLDDVWTAETPTSGAPDGRASHVAVWTGTSMIVWGGEVNATLVNTGGIYGPPIPSLGTNRGSLTFTAAGANNSPRTITVDLTAVP